MILCDGCLSAIGEASIFLCLESAEDNLQKKIQKNADFCSKMIDFA